MNNNNVSCGNMDPDEATVHDYVELKLTLKVPTNARSFSFNFIFMIRGISRVGRHTPSTTSSSPCSSPSPLTEISHSIR